MRRIVILSVGFHIDTDDSLTEPHLFGGAVQFLHLQTFG